MHLSPVTLSMSIGCVGAIVAGCAVPDVDEGAQEMAISTAADLGIQASGVWVRNPGSSGCADECEAPTCSCITDRCSGNPEGLACSPIDDECNIVSGSSYRSLRCATPPPPPPVFNFGGTYAGTASGAAGSTGTADLTIVQAESDLTLDLVVDTGLLLDLGVCGTHELGRLATGEIAATVTGARHAEGTFSQFVMNTTVVVPFTLDLSANGNVITGNMTVEVPFPCADATLSATLTRVGAPVPPQPFSRLRVQVRNAGGTGWVESRPLPGIDCPADCAQSFVTGTSVTLWPYSYPGSFFDHWECGNTYQWGGAITLPVTADTTCVAEFSSLW